MREAFFQLQWLFGDDQGVSGVHAADQFVGLSLGYDRCAEHEFGIDGIARAFGVPSALYPDGRFSVEQLDAWIDGRGPVLKERHAEPA